MFDKQLKTAVAKTKSSKQWKKIGIHSRSGVAVPLFSIYSKKSLGIGEFSDLKFMIDWCVKTGNSVIQLLPMNELGAVNCPYDSISSFALEPAYISLVLIPGVNKKAIKEKLNKLQKKYSVKNNVDYAVKFDKLSIMWDLYQDSSSVESLEFKKFLKKNSFWIDDYALYKELKFLNGDAPWYEWETAFCNREVEALEWFKCDRSNSLLFHKWVQWIAYEQFSDVKSYAKSKSVLLKGDLPVLVSRDSVDVWAHTEYFKMDLCAGAPPDMYCASGQRWGMPTYNWHNIAHDSYRYLREKLQYAESFYDILRVDHVVGLFRIWSISVDEPMENQGLNGFFDPGDESYWEEHGKAILAEMISETKMLLCAEDLGVVPDACIETLEEFGIPGNDVQRWVKDWDTRNDFLSPQEYRILSVAMLSTHDTSNWAAWWENEAGTLDEAMFVRKCEEYGIDSQRILPLLFDDKRSRHGRLRWLKKINTVDELQKIIGRPIDQIEEFVGLYLNSYEEKEKLWKLMGLKGKMREKCNKEIIAAIIEFTARSKAVFCVESIVDWLVYAGILKGDPYKYRINKPGTVTDANWSLRLPISLEELVTHPTNKEIKKILTNAERLV